MSTSTGTPAAAVYVRISSDPSGERAGVERQRSDCEKLAHDLGYATIRLYEDNDISAYSGATRPAFEQLIADATAGHLDAVIVWATDRLYRRMADLVRITSDLAPHARIHCVTGGDVDLETADGILRAQMLGSVAEFESRRKAERITARCKQRALVERRTSTSQLPFGWQWNDPDPDNPQRPRPGSRSGVRPDPVTGPALATAYADVASGVSLYSAHRKLTETVDVGKMTSSTLGLILRNPRNAGLVSYKDQIVGEAADGRAIVDRELFEQVLAILSDPSRRTSPGRPSNTWLGGGLLRCGLCSGPMAASRKSEAPVYICSRNQCMSVRRARLDPPVLAIAGQILTELGTAGLLAQAAGDDTIAHGLRERIAAAEQRLEALAGLLAAGELDPADYALSAGKIRTAMNDDAQALASRSARPAVSAMAGTDDVAATWQRHLDNGDTATVRAVLADLMESIVQPRHEAPVVTWQPWTGLAPTTVTVPGRTRSGAIRRREQVARLHAEGLPILRIAERLQTSRSTVRADLRTLGLYTS